MAQKNVFGAEIAAKEMDGLTLLDALDYVLLLAEVRPSALQTEKVPGLGTVGWASVRQCTLSGGSVKGKCSARRRAFPARSSSRYA
jgi:hypothetical protein